MTTSMRSFLVAAAAAAAFAFLPGAARAAGARTVICKDGTTSAAGRGACSGHGGVDKDATAKAKAKDAAEKKEAKAKKAQEKAEAKAKAKKEAGEAKAKKEAAKAEPKAKAAKEAGEAATTVTCKDGTTSRAGRGACRGHGGVDKGASAKGAAPAAAPAPMAAPAAAPAAHREMPAAAAQRPAAHEKPDAAKGPPTARCKDGTLSYAEHHTGACSNHGGVAEWLDKK